MLKATAQSARPKKRIRRTTEPAGIGGRIIQAALDTLKTEGFAGTSARVIARSGGFNQALIFYHFGTVPDLLLAALDQISEERLERYRAAVAGISTLTALADRLSELYAEDMKNQHITAIQELVSGSSSNPALGQEIVIRLEPWMVFVEEVVGRFLEDSIFESMVPARELAYAGIALYMGMETLTHLDGDRVRVAELFETAKRMAPMLDMVLAQGKSDA
jgi:AcrR family transcriptional regulator